MPYFVVLDHNGLSRYFFGDVGCAASAVGGRTTNILMTVITGSPLLQCMLVGEAGRNMQIFLRAREDASMSCCSVTVESCICRSIIDTCRDYT